MASTFSNTPWTSPASSSTFTGFSVKNTILYIGLSLGVLLLVLFLLSVSLIYCVRPGRRRQQLVLAAQQRERQRTAALDAVKADEEVFKPQVRPLPVVVLQPGASNVAFGKKLSLERSMAPGARHESSVPAAADPEDPEKGEAGITEDVAESSGAASQGSNPAASGAESVEFRSVCSGASSTLTASSSESDGKGKDAPAKEESPPHFNPLTHYLTERNARYFEANVDV